MTNTPGLTLHVDDWDDDGTLYTVVGRGDPVATYCVLTMRAVLLARMTRAERAPLGLRGPEEFVTRDDVHRDERADCDYLDTGAADAPWAA